MASSSKRTKIPVSKGKRKAPPAQYFDESDDEVWFNSPSAKSRFEEYKKKKIEPGRNILCSEFPQFDIIRYFDALSWTPLLHQSKPWFPKLIHMFYSNISISGSENSLTITSYVKGVPISFDIEDLGNILHVPSSGIMRFMTPKFSASDFFDVEEIYGTLMMAYRLPHKVKAIEFHPIPRILHLIITHNFLPVGGHRDQVSAMMAYLNFSIMHGDKLNLPFIIMRYMELYAMPSYPGNLPFGILLTKILKHFEVDFTDEEIGKEPLPLNAATLRRMRLLPGRHQAPVDISDSDEDDPVEKDANEEEEQDDDEDDPEEHFTPAGFTDDPTTHTPVTPAARTSSVPPYATQADIDRVMARLETICGENRQTFHLVQRMMHHLGIPPPEDLPASPPADD